MDELTRGDAERYFRVEAIRFPVNGDNPIGNGPAIYVKSFFDGYVGVTKNRPIPGSKRGHELFSSRPHNDFYTVGGKVVDNGDGTGIAYLKVYIPPEGDGTSNFGFIRDNRAGIVQFSLIAHGNFTIDSVTETVEANAVINDDWIRNDAVEVGKMEQTVNSEEIGISENASTDRLLKASVSKARGLINSGNYDNSSKWSFSAADGNKLLGSGGNDWAEYKSWHLVEDTSATANTRARYKYPYGKGGKVYRSALRAIAARASAQNLQDVSAAASALIAAIDKKAKSGGSLMDTKEEALEFLGVNSGIPIAEIAKVMNQSDKLVTNEHIQALQTVNDLKALGFNSVDDVKKLADAVAKNEQMLVGNRLTAEFGPEKGADGSPNLLRVYAGKVITNSKDIDAQLEEFKKDPIALQFAANRADFTKNVVKVHEQGGKPVDEDPDAPIEADY